MGRGDRRCQIRRPFVTAILTRLLVATDGSPSGARAVDFAIALARKRSSEIILCSALDRAGAIAQSSTVGGFDSGLPLVDALETSVESVLAAAAKKVDEAGVLVQTLLADGRSARAIVRCANERHADAIVVGTEGKRGFERFFLGSTADGVLRYTDVPTFVLPPTATAGEADFERVLVAVDDSDPSDAAAAFAVDVARTSASQLIFFAAIATGDLLEQAAALHYDRMSMLEELHASAHALLAVHTARARAHGVRCESVVVEDDPTTAIVHAARIHDASLLVVGTHGRRGLQRLFIGSVAESVVRQSPVPVVVVRASHRRTAEI